MKTRRERLKSTSRLRLQKSNKISDWFLEISHKFSSAKRYPKGLC